MLQRGVVGVIIFYFAAYTLRCVHLLCTATTDSTRDKSELRRAIRDHYDILSPYYHMIWGPHLHHGLWRDGNETKDEACQKLVDELSTINGTLQNHRVLDVGCGYGGASVFLASERNCDMTGITVSKTQVQMASDYAKSRGVSDKTKFVVMNGEDLKFEDATFDHIYTTEVISHMGDKAAFFKGAYRVLKPGGTIRMMDWFKKAGLSDKEEREMVYPIEMGMLLPGLDTMGQYEVLAWEAGFSNIYHEDVSKEMEKTWILLTEWKPLLTIGAHMMFDPSCHMAMWTHGVEMANFLYSFFDMKAGFSNGAFRTGLLVFKK